MGTAGRMERAAMELETEGMSEFTKRMVKASAASNAGNTAEASRIIAGILDEMLGFEDSDPRKVISMCYLLLLELTDATGLTVEQIVEKVLGDQKANVRATKPILYRDHRGGLAESMETVKSFASRNELVEYLRKSMGSGYSVDLDWSKLTIAKYGDGIDRRCGWDTHIVTLDGCGVLGFTDGPVADEKDDKP